MTRFVKDVLTGVDNQTYDGGRVLCFLSYSVYFGLSITNFMTTHIWSAMDFSGGVSAMAVGFGLHFYMKKDTEPRV